MTDNNGNINSCLMNMIGSIIRKKTDVIQKETCYRNKKLI